MSVLLRPPKGGKRHVKRRWIREGELPFSRTVARKLDDQGLLVSALLRVPGSSRSIRLYDGDSLDRYLERLAAEQRKEGALV
jgi:hypothetical protein